MNPPIFAGPAAAGSPTVTKQQNTLPSFLLRSASFGGLAVVMSQ